VNRSWQLALAASVALLGSCGISHAAEWTPVKAESNTERISSSTAPIRWIPVQEEPSTASQQPQWKELTDDPDHALPDAVVWTPVEPSVAADIEEKIEEEAPIKDPANTAIAIQPPVMPSGATFANDKAIWRDDEWHPQISSLVPIGFGPKGLMLTGSLYGWDCIPAPHGPCKQPDSLKSYIDEIEIRAEGDVEITLGYGDPEKLLGFTLTHVSSETDIRLGNRNRNEKNSNPFFQDYYVGASLSRNLGPDTALKIGIKNWLDVREEAAGEAQRAKSAYGVVSQRIRLKDNQQNWFPNLYLTAGLGNGEFRSVDEKFKSSVAKQREAGCHTYGFNEGPNCSEKTRQRAGARSLMYGKLVPIGTIALEVYPGFNLISEWNQGNLKAGFSVRPFNDLGLVFTSMWGSLLQNCDWGCKVPIRDVKGGVDLEEDLITERVEWSAHVNLNIKF